MINPSEVGKSGEMVRLRTLESIWVQGKLRMWGRWSYIGGGSGGNMFNQLLASREITKTAINDALRRMKKSGLTILLVEQNVNQALSVADRAYVMRLGAIVASGTADEIRSGSDLSAHYLGG